MIGTKWLKILAVSIFAILLLGYQTGALAQQPGPSSSPLAAPTVAPVFTASSNTTPAARTNPNRSPIPLLQDRSPQAIGISSPGQALSGVWEDSDHNLIIKFYPQATAVAVQGLARLRGLGITDENGTACDAYARFTYQDQVITWGKATRYCNESTSLQVGNAQVWENGTAVQYKITLVTLGDGSKTMLFTLIGEDPIAARRGFLDGQTFTSAPPGITAQK